MLIIVSTPILYDRLHHIDLYRLPAKCDLSFLDIPDMFKTSYHFSDYVMNIIIICRHFPDRMVTEDERGLLTSILY